MLEVVEKPEVVLNNDDYEPMLLSSKEAFDKYWDACIPHLERCVNEAMHGEMTVDDIYNKALAGQFYVIAVKNDQLEVPDVKLVLVLEVVYYPRYATMNVVALGGKDLRHMIKRFWSYVCGWAYINGVRKMECSVAPAMQKILEAVGFQQQYVQLRQDLKEV